MVVRLVWSIVPQPAPTSLLKMPTYVGFFLYGPLSSTRPLDAEMVSVISAALVIDYKQVVFMTKLVRVGSTFCLYKLHWLPNASTIYPLQS